MLNNIYSLNFLAARLLYSWHFQQMPVQNS